MKKITVKNAILFLLLLISGLFIGINTGFLPYGLKINLFVIGNYNNHFHVNGDSGAPKNHPILH